MSARRVVPVLLLGLLVAGSLRAQPLPGQVIVHPDNPQLLYRNGVGPVFLVGPGDPEEFFYRGTEQPDGTFLGGNQDEILAEMIEHGGNTMYLTLIRSHGGDGPGHHNPFLNGDPDTGQLEPAMADQWEEWLTVMDDNGIIPTMIIFDDKSRPWGVGDVVPDMERQFIENLVNRYEHHRNLMWGIGEETSFYYYCDCNHHRVFSLPRIEAVAEIVHQADDHDHVIHNHHWVWDVGAPPRPPDRYWFHQGDSEYIDSWFIELGRHHDNNDTPEGLHASLLRAYELAVERDYSVTLAEVWSNNPYLAWEGGPHGTGHTLRWTNWAAAMSGANGVEILYIFTNRGNRTEEQRQNDLGYCRIQQEFLESTDFDTMVPRDDLAHATTNWVLANEGQSYLGYRYQGLGDMGFLGIPEEALRDLIWLDTVSGDRVEELNRVVGAGDQAFPPPGGFGEEVVLWMRLSPDQDGDLVLDDIDNCLDFPNPDQADADSDGAGDGCDPCPDDPLDDVDGDTHCADVDNCPTMSNGLQNDFDGDGAGDPCDPCPLDGEDDADGDGFCANIDNCLGLANPLQVDLDGDGAGDSCDPCPLDADDDGDGDGLCANLDNCPLLPNAEQADLDADGIGDDCDLDLDGDGFDNDVDCAPTDFGDGSMAPPLTDLRVGFSASQLRITWAPASEGLDDPEARHLVIRGDLTALHRDRGFDAACRLDGTNEPSFFDPAAGRSEPSWYYLVQGLNDCGVGELLVTAEARVGLSAMGLPACP